LNQLFVIAPPGERHGENRNQQQNRGDAEANPFPRLLGNAKLELVVFHRVSAMREAPSIRNGGGMS
jgi:hypothetical protein